MILNSVIIKNFRNFSEKSFEFHPHLTIIFGENARGKTNLLEAVYLLVNGTGFRESKEEELIRWNESQSLIEGAWNDKGSDLIHQIMIQKRGESVEKRFFVNKAKKTHALYAQYQTKTVLFAPEHIEIVTGPPDNRRDYFNKFIFTFDLEYKKKFHNYEHALYKRNKLLEYHTRPQLLQDELLFWDGYLENHGSYITQTRQKYTDFLNDHNVVDSKVFTIEYLKNEFNQEGLKRTFQEQQRLRRTLIGPQKDDFQIHLRNGEKKNIHHFGSRSEQRLGVFWLKLNEIEYFQTQFKIKPILLLDDVFSELDTKNKQLILNLIGNYQTILTTTERELIELTHIDRSIIKL